MAGRLIIIKGVYNGRGAYYRVYIENGRLLGMIIQYKCPYSGYRAILKWDGEISKSGIPLRIFSFIIDPRSRDILGRWIETPNWSIASFVKRKAGLLK